jgi:hypothetical protein
MSKLVEATHVTLGGEIGSPDAWAHPYLDDEHMRYASEPAGAAARSPKLETRRQRRLELLLTLRRAREQLGRWPMAGRVGGRDQRARLLSQLRAPVRQLAAGLPNGGATEAMSFTLLVPADDWRPIALRELTEGRDRFSPGPLVVLHLSSRPGFCTARFWPG